MTWSDQKVKILICDKYRGFGICVNFTVNETYITRKKGERHYLKQLIVWVPTGLKRTQNAHPVVCSVGWRRMFSKFPFWRGMPLPLRCFFCLVLERWWNIELHVLNVRSRTNFSGEVKRQCKVIGSSYLAPSISKAKRKKRCGLGLWGKHSAAVQKVCTFLCKTTSDI